MTPAEPKGVLFECRVCGQWFVRLDTDPEDDKVCFCCSHQIPLFPRKTKDEK